jgi:hypothetical protein
MDFELLSEITQIEPIARGAGVDIHNYLNHKYAGGRRVRWRKLKGIAWIKWLLPEQYGQIEKAELHWFEGHGIGRVELKYKKGAKR